MIKNTLFTSLFLLFFSAGFSQTALWRILNDNVSNTNLGGNVGIGTMMPTERLTVSGNALITGGTQTAGIVLGSKAPAIDYPFDYESIGVAQPGQDLRLQSPNSIYFHTNISGTEADAATNKIRMTIRSNGNVGIGTTTPRQALDITGNLVLNTGNRIQFNNGNTRLGFLEHSGNDLTLRNEKAEGDGDISIISEDDIAISANGDDLFLTAQDDISLRAGGTTTRLFINNSGNVGIGTTSPSELLHVNGRVRAGNLSVGAWPSNPSTYVFFGSNSISQTNASNYALLQHRTTGRTYLNSTETIRFRIDNADRMVLANNGNIGMGTTNPQHKLHVQGRMMLNNGVIQRGGSPITNTSDLGLYSRVSGNWLRFVSNGGRHAFFTDGNSNPIGSSPEMVINTNGAVTINNGFGWRTLGSDIIELTVNGQADKPGGGDWISFSDKRLKQDINSFDFGLETVKKIKPVTYHYNGKLGLDSAPEYVGIIAQELQKIAPFMVKEASSSEDKGKYLIVDPSAFTYMLINSVQEQQEIIEAQEEKLARQVSKNEDLQTQVNQLSADLEALKNLVQQLTTNEETPISRQAATLDHVQLSQNQPNPFSETTTIQYVIPETATAAMMQITNAEGKLIKQIQIDAKGKGELVLEAKSLPAGSYWYSLVLDGKVMESKQMILTE